MSESKYLPGCELDALEVLLRECLISHQAEEGDPEQFVLNVLEVLGQVYPAAIDELFAKIAHGADDHRVWLRTEMTKWFSGGF